MKASNIQFKTPEYENMEMYDESEEGSSQVLSDAVMMDSSTPFKSAESPKLKGSESPLQLTPMVSRLPPSEPLSPISKSDSSIFSASEQSVVSSLSIDESHADGYLHGAYLLNALHEGSWDLSELSPEPKTAPKPPTQTRYSIVPRAHIPVTSSSSDSSRDSSGKKVKVKTTKTENKALNNEKGSSSRRVTLSFKSMSSLRKSLSLPPLSMTSSRSLPQTHPRPDTVSRDVSADTQQSMEYAPIFMSPTAMTTGSFNSTNSRERNHSLPLYLPRPKIHTRNPSNGSSVVSGAEISSFPIVGYISDENSKIIMQQGSEDNSTKGSVEERKKKSWVSKELKYLSKKWCSKINSNNPNKSLELKRARGYLM